MNGSGRSKPHVPGRGRVNDCIGAAVFQVDLGSSDLNVVRQRVQAEGGRRPFFVTGELQDIDHSKDHLTPCWHHVHAGIPCRLRLV